jgi:hypothetical protein
MLLTQVFHDSSLPRMIPEAVSFIPWCGASVLIHVYAPKRPRSGPSSVSGTRKTTSDVFLVPNRGDLPYSVRTQTPPRLDKTQWHPSEKFSNDRELTGAGPRRQFGVSKSEPSVSWRDSYPPGRMSSHRFDIKMLNDEADSTVGPCTVTSFARPRATRIHLNVSHTYCLIGSCHRCTCSPY